jgi:hypothetical protein
MSSFSFPLSSLLKLILWASHTLAVFQKQTNKTGVPKGSCHTLCALSWSLFSTTAPLFGWAYQHGLSAVEQYFSLTANQPQPAYKPKNSLPNRPSTLTAGRASQHLWLQGELMLTCSDMGNMEDQKR